MKCEEFDGALGSPELRAHAEECERCRRELELWDEISRLAPGLHKEWDTPALWPRIEQALASEAPRRRLLVDWRWLGAVAAVSIVAVLLVRPWRTAPTDTAASRVFLTEQALREVESAEAAYARSIERLAQLAEPGLRRLHRFLAAYCLARVAGRDRGRHDPLHAPVRLPRRRARSALRALTVAAC